MARSDRGQSVTAFFAVVVTALLLVCGLVVDGGRQTSAARQAEAVAREAARTGAQAMTADALRGGVTAVDPARGRAAATAYLRSSGVDGDVTVTGARVVVTTRISTPTVFLSIIHIDHLNATATAEAEATRVLDGRPR